MKAKVKLLDITQSLTEGVIGGQKFAPQTRQSNHINRKELIKKTLMQEKVSASPTLSEPHSCDEDDETTNSRSDSESTATFTNHPEDEQRQETLLGSCDISHIKESDVFSGRVRLTEQQVRSFVEHRTSWPLFEEVFMVSAKNGIGVDDLRDFLMACAHPRPWIFSSQVRILY